MSQHVYTFMPRFVPLVEDGRKRQTFRCRIRDPKPGDTLSLRCWTGRPYGSAQRILGTAKCERVVRCTITIGKIHIAGGGLTPRDADAFAVADGFLDAADLFAFFIAARGLGRKHPRITGTVTYWHPLERSAVAEKFPHPAAPAETHTAQTTTP